MIIFSKIVSVLFLIVTLSSGCAYHNIEKAKESPDNKNKFSQALSEQYLEFALYEMNEMHDEWDANHFALKSLAAKKGNKVLPELVSDWNIDTHHIEEAERKRIDILKTLHTDKEQEYPQLAARSQLGFDCWLEQLEEGWQHEHIKLCYDMMNNSLSKLKEKLSAKADINNTTKENTNPDKIRENQVTPAKVIVNKENNKNVSNTKEIKIYFEHNSYKLNEKAKNTLTMFLDKITAGYTRIILEGHTDRSGTEKYNLNLAELRAKKVKEFLLKKGMEEKTIITKIYGESKPLVHTKDGIKEPRNRRVKIEISYDQNFVSRL